MNAEGVRNARFWIWFSAGDCWVKLTLRPGQKLGFAHGGPSDEGSYYRSETYEHVGDGVMSEEYSDCTDCDGRLMELHTHFCKLEELQADDGRLDDDGVMRPVWKRVSASQRDEYAERAGY